MTDQEAWPNLVRLAGVEVRFGPFEVGRRPAHDLNEEAEATLAALGDGGRSRLLRLTHGVCTGVEAGVVRREHLRAIAAAVGELVLMVHALLIGPDDGEGEARPVVGKLITSLAESGMVKGWATLLIGSSSASWSRRPGPARPE